MRLLTFVVGVLAFATLCVGETKICSPTEFSCANGQECIPLAWRCDNSHDCKDQSDEKECSATTCSDSMYRCTDGKCISDRWLCDGTNDCEDGSDETKKTCDSLVCDGYRCNDGKCIPLTWQCDGSEDCDSKDDEENCKPSCDSDEFQCSDGKCITLSWQCDKREDCDDGSDEKNCTSGKGSTDDNTQCDGIGYKMCDDGECLNESWFCDGDIDCKDQSDEKNCNTTAPPPCESGEFKCLTAPHVTECIALSWKCDGFPDCTDGSDENAKECEKFTCKPDERKCGVHYCMNKDFFCDGEPDCSDGSDEVGCPPIDEEFLELHCQNGTFDCFKDGEQCVEFSKVCDGRKDCNNGADEAEEQKCPNETENVCLTNNGGCPQTCVPTLSEPSKRLCKCFPGYLEKNGRCEDIDECKIHGTCSQSCENTLGSFKCHCMKGYEMLDHRHCKAVAEKRPELILTARNELRSYHLDTYHYTLLLKQEVSAASLDFNFRQNRVFWTDVGESKVYSADLATNNRKTIIEDEEFQMLDGIAVDWIHENLYISDTGNNVIEVSKLDGTSRKTLISKDLDEPRSIALDPENGMMYWTDWGTTAKIEKCGMNGANRKVIISQGVAWPNGLTIDYVGSRLYWVDGKKREIGSADLDGNDFKIILTDHLNLGHPYGITVFEDFLYWTDWMTESVHKVSKFADENRNKNQDVTTLALNLKSPMDIHVFHEFRQPQVTSRCFQNKCSHLCLPKAKIGVKTVDYECACPNYLKLLNATQCATKDGVVVTLRPPTNVVPTERPYDVTTEQGKRNESSTQENEPESESGHGLIMAVVIGVLLVVGILIAVVVFILVRRHKMKNVMSMNFDNPVYRKTTTDDQLVMDKNSVSRDASLQPLNTENEVV